MKPKIFCVALLMLLSCVITNVDGREDPHFLIRTKDEDKLSVTYFCLLIPGKITPRYGSCLDRRVGLNVAVDKYLFEEWKTNLMSLAILFHFLCAQHVSDIRLKPAKRTPPKTSRTKSSNTQRTAKKTTDVVIHQHCRKLLMMDILMSETCWAHKKWNKIPSDIKLGC